MKNFLETVKTKLSALPLSGIFLLLLGICFLVFPAASIHVLCVIFGVILILCAVTRFALRFSTVNGDLVSVLAVIADVVLVVFGILLIVNSAATFSLLAVVTGIVLIFRGALGVMNLLAFTRVGDHLTADVKVLLVLEGITVLFGILLIIFSAVAEGAVAILLGIAFLFDAVDEFLTYAKSRREEKKARIESGVIENAEYVDKSDEV